MFNRMKAMKSKMKTVSLFSLLVLSACSAAPKPAAPVVVEAYHVPAWATPHYFKELPFVLNKAIPNPPADGSPEDRKDLDEVRGWETKRTKAQCELAHTQELPTLENSFGHSKDRKGTPDFSKLDPKVYQELKTFFGNLERDVAYVALEAKEVWKRPRPFDRDKNIHPCVKLENSYAYPSGHSAFGEAGGIILGEIFPKNAKSLLQAGEQVGKNRILGGVHHPSDVTSGFEIARKTLEALRKDPKFVSDLEAIKKAVAGKELL